MKKYKCRGLACVPKTKRKKIARMGALKLHALGRAGCFTTKTGRAAAKKRYQKTYI